VNNNVGKIHIYVCGEREREEQNEKDPVVRNYEDTRKGRG
jgi:hypothetical protein